MREILFRGKRVDNGEWVEGFFCGESCDSIFSPMYEQANIIKKGTGMWSSVIPETVGQYTGLKDKNGKRIFDGDVVKAQDEIWGSPFCDGIIGKVVYDEAAYFIEPKNPMNSQWLFNECAVYEIIGNIHDNPEILKGE